MGGRQMAPGSPVKQGKALSPGALPVFPNKGREHQNHHPDHKYFANKMTTTKYGIDHGNIKD